MIRLTVVYDASCGFCCSSVEWLSRQPTLVELELLPRSSALAAERWPELRPAAETLTVVGDDGSVYRGDGAFIAALWALEGYRRWAARLASPALLPLARQGFRLVSQRRHRISEWLSLESDAEVALALRNVMGADAPHCLKPVFSEGRPAPAAPPRGGTP